MPDTLRQLLAAITPDTLIGLAAGGLVVWLWLRLRRALRRARARRFNPGDAGNQLRFVEAAEFYARRPINREAFRIYREMESYLPSRRDGHRLLAEISLGAFIGTSRETGSAASRDRAFASINSKRIDFLVIDRFGHPAAAIEYHGSGHYQGDAVARDAVKRRALQKAGIEIIEIHEGTPNTEIRTRLAHALNRHAG